MIIIFTIFIYDYIVDEKYEIEYSRYYNPISYEEKVRIDSEKEKNNILDLLHYFIV